MFLHLLQYLDRIDGYLWSYLAIPAILLIGSILSIRFRGAQLLRFPTVLRSFFLTSRGKKSMAGKKGVHPLSAFFASIGGCIGIGNLVAVCTAVQIGGPGAIFWMWVAAFIGMILKYAEVYLGICHRIPNREGGYDGGPMYYLQRICKSRFLPMLFCFFLAIYGTEVYMFDVMTHTVVENWHIMPYPVIATILAFVIYASSGGVRRIGKVCSVILPLFLVLFCGMSAWILLSHLSELPSLFYTIFRSAFSGYAPVGGFTGAGIMLAMSQGIARGCYSGDIGIGNASIIHAESRQSNPKKQAQLAILGVFLDTFVVCTATTLLILVTGVWKEGVMASMMVQRALEQYFPYMNYFMPIFLLILGYSSLISFFCVGLKCAKFIHPQKGKKIYYLYAIAAFLLFSFLDQSYALTVMSVTGAILLSINLFGIYSLRKEIEMF